MMRVLRMASFGILETSFFAALCALALCAGAETLFAGYPLKLITPLHALVAGGTLLEYNVHHLFNAGLDPEAPPQTQERRFVHIFFVLFGAALCVWGFFGVSFKSQVLCIIFGVLSFAYSTPLLPFTYKKRLKDFGLTKISVLTAVWVGVTTILPAAESEFWSKLLILECALRTLLIFPLCIAFDLRDTAADKLHGIRTLPNTIGIQRSQQLMRASILLFLLVGSSYWLYQNDKGMAVNALIAAIAAYATTTAAGKHRKTFIYLFLVDGVMLLYGCGQLLFGRGV